MAVAVFEGLIEETGNGVIRNGTVTDYEYIKIGGKRIRHIRCQNYLDSMIKPGNTVRLSCVKSLGKHTVYAVQESNGEVSKNPLYYAMVNSGVVVVFCVLVLFFPAIAMYVSGYQASGLFTFFGVTGLLTWFGSKDHYQARNALDNLPAPGVAS